MKVGVSKKLCSELKKEHKNPDYSLKCLLDNLDIDYCVNLFKVPEEIKFGDDKNTVDISDDTLDLVSSIFGNCDSALIETLIWISAFLPEI